MKNRFAGLPGFTLIELMVVIVILGILAAVIAPRIPQFVAKAKDGKTKGNLATLRSTINIYYADNDGTYPMGSLWASLVPKLLRKIPELDLPGTTHSPSSTVGQVAVFNPPQVMQLGQAAIFADPGNWCYCELVNGLTPMGIGVRKEWGDFWVGCNHTDITGNRWTSF